MLLKALLGLKLPHLGGKIYLPLVGIILWLASLIHNVCFRCCLVELWFKGAGPKVSSVVFTRMSDSHRHAAGLPHI